VERFVQGWERNGQGFVGKAWVCIASVAKCGGAVSSGSSPCMWQRRAGTRHPRVFVPHARLCLPFLPMVSMAPLSSRGWELIPALTRVMVMHMLSGSSVGGEAPLSVWCWPGDSALTPALVGPRRLGSGVGCEPAAWLECRLRMWALSGALSAALLSHASASRGSPTLAGLLGAHLRCHSSASCGPMMRVLAVGLRSRASAGCAPSLRSGAGGALHISLECWLRFSLWLGRWPHISSLTRMLATPLRSPLECRLRLSALARMLDATLRQRLSVGCQSSLAGVLPADPRPHSRVGRQFPPSPLSVACASPHLRECWV
jgi:hypothetical protein